MIWTRNPPAWTSGEATLQRATAARGNPGYAGVVLRSGRHRAGFTPDHPPYEGIEQRLAALSAIAIPGGMANFPATDHQPRQAPPYARRSS